MKEQAPNTTPLPKEVLIVEDSATQAAVLKLALEKHGWRVRVAGDGVDALELARLSRPDIVISDILMPRMDGYALSKAIKTDPTLNTVPVVLFTVLSQSRDIVDAINGQADYYFLKEWDHDVLIAKLAAILDTHQPWTDQDRNEFTVCLDGESYTITANAQRPLTLLLSTYDIAVQQGRALAAARDTLQEANASLEATVRERTAQFMASERRYRRLFEAARDGILILDGETGMILDVNPFLVELTGTSRESFLGKNVWEVGCFKQLFADQTDFTELQKKEFTHCEDKPLETSDGRWVEVEVVSSVYLVNDHRRIQCNIRDITERKQAEDAVRQAKEDWEKTFDAVPDGIMILDLEYRVKQINRAYTALLESPQADCLGRTCYELLHGTAEPPSYCPHARMLEDGQKHAIEIREERLGKDLALGVFPLRNREGSLTGSVHIISDITERKQAENALREKTQLLQFILDNMFDLVSLTDLQGNFKFVSASHKILNYDLDSLIGRNVLEFVHPEDFPGISSLLRDFLAKGDDSQKAELRYRCADGSYLWFATVGKLIRDNSGNPREMLFSTRDITERKRAEADRIARQDAEQASRAKSAFLANMSHEIRTPLNAVLGFAQILERDASLSSRQTGMIQSITRSGRHLLDLINDLLDMSKIEAGRIELSPVEFCLHDLLEDLEMMFRSRAQEKQLQLLMERDDSVPRYVNADEGKLRQVLINLMGNAVKFTRTGGGFVRVRAETEPCSSGGDANALRLVVEVEDSGPGIAEDELDCIFEPFRQSAAGREAGGTGLGLAVSRRLVELMGGRLTVKSQVGKGSCFRFDLLVKPAEASAHEQTPAMRQVVGLAPGTGPFRILVVDDQQDNRDLLAALLEPVGFELREAVNGQEALDVFDTWSPHAVLMDIRMPVLDGYEATRRIKATEKGRAIPVIAVTASAFAKAEKEVLAAGVDGYVRKPFRSEEILTVLGKCLGLRYVYAETVGQAPEQTDVHPLTRAELAGLPESLRQTMRQAIDEGDMAGMRTMIAQAEEKDAEAARKLRNLAAQYDYEALMQVLAE